MAQAVVHRTKDGFQQQYGTLWKAAEAYLDGSMLVQQAASFENVCPADLIAAVASTRLLNDLVQWVKQI